MLCWCIIGSQVDFGSLVSMLEWLLIDSLFYLGWWNAYFEKINGPEQFPVLEPDGIHVKWHFAWLSGVVSAALLKFLNALENISWKK